jgi:hypothetical protein
MMILAFAVMSSVHELLYQRALWLFLGAVLALRPAAVDQLGWRKKQNAADIVAAAT